MNFDREEFHTYRGYDLAYKKEQELTPSMEDYVEMIYRMSREKGFARVNDLAQALNVKPPSVTSMVQRLHERNLIRYEKYGVILLTNAGLKVGGFLLKRHRMLEKFMQALGVTENVLENVERIEHNLTSEATQRLFALVEYIEKNPEWFKPFQEYCQRLYEIKTEQISSNKKTP